MKMDAFYIIVIAIVLAALFGFFVSYREDHPKKSSSEK